jgi:hypothetical protein
MEGEGWCCQDEGSGTEHCDIFHIYKLMFATFSMTPYPVCLRLVTFQ